MSFIQSAKEVLDIEIQALESMRDAIDDNFDAIVESIVRCKGKIVVTGIGKSGHVAKKIAATFSSLGTPSFYLHPAEALHGDLGMVTEQDVVILISNSGESQEIIRMLPSLKLIGAKLIGITSGCNSTLAKECDNLQLMPELKEACALNLAPTSSTTAVMAYGDALAVAISRYYHFTKENFALFHPEGALGKKILLRVQDIMAKETEMPLIKQGSLITDAIMEMSKKGLGVVVIVDKNNCLAGILTDGDLRRAIEKKADMYQDTVDTVMSYNPKSIHAGMLLVDALNELKKSHLNNYPVINEQQEVIGVITWQMIIRAGIMV